MSKKRKNKRDDVEKAVVNTAWSKVAANSVDGSVKAANVKFEKPDKYDRHIYDDGQAKQQAKEIAFSKDNVADPYTKKPIELRQQDARIKYGNTEQAAESDHIVPLKNVHEEYKKNPWVTNQDIKQEANSQDNIQVVSREFNNKKRKKTNKEYATDTDYQKKTGLELPEDGKARAIADGDKAKKTLDKKLGRDAMRNIADTAHSAGLLAAKQAGLMAASTSIVVNMTAVIKGEKDAFKAIQDIGVDTGVAVASGYGMGAILTVASQSLANSTSPMINALTKSNMPAQVVSTAISIGNIVMRCGSGEISLEECLVELGQTNTAYAAMAVTMVEGQALIPIPIVGALIGGMVGYAMTTAAYQPLLDALKGQRLAAGQRAKIEQECEENIRLIREYRAQMEGIISEYLVSNSETFHSAFDEIKISLAIGDVDGFISGTNKITAALGKPSQFNTMDEFEGIMNSDAGFVL